MRVVRFVAVILAGAVCGSLCAAAGMLAVAAPAAPIAWMWAAAAVLISLATHAAIASAFRAAGRADGISDLTNGRL